MGERGGYTDQPVESTRGYGIVVWDLMVPSINSNVITMIIALGQEAFKRNTKVSPPAWQYRPCTYIDKLWHYPGDIMRVRSSLAVLCVQVTHL